MPSKNCGFHGQHRAFYGVLLTCFIFNRAFKILCYFFAFRSSVFKSSVTMKLYLLDTTSIKNTTCHGLGHLVGKYMQDLGTVNHCRFIFKCAAVIVFVLVSSLLSQPGSRLEAEIMVFYWSVDLEACHMLSWKMLLLMADVCTCMTSALVLLWLSEWNIFCYYI